MVDGDSYRLLTINSGFSSIKFALCRLPRIASTEMSGSIAGISRGFVVVHVKDGQGKTRPHPLAYLWSSGISRNPLTVRVMKTNEELMIVRHTRKLLLREPAAEREQGF